MASPVEKEPSPAGSGHIQPPNIQSLLLTDHYTTPKLAQCSSEAQNSAVLWSTVLYCCDYLSGAHFSHSSEQAV